MGVLERRLEDPNYDSLTQLIKRKGQKEMNDLSVVDSKVQLNDTKDDTNNDTDNVTSNDNRVTWSKYAQQRITYGDGDDTTDISKTLTSVIQPDKYQGSLVKQPYLYKSYKDAYNGSHITYGRYTITHHENPTNSIQVTSK